MGFIVGLFIGILGGAFLVYALLENRRKVIYEAEVALAATQAKEQELRQLATELTTQRESLRTNLTAFEQRVVTYQDLQNENAILKKDIRASELNLRKMQLDVESRHRQSSEIGQRAEELGKRYLRENVDWIGRTLNANNFAGQKQKLRDVVEWCRSIGMEVSTEDEAARLNDLKKEYERVVRAAEHREEQARIKAEIREEQRRERDLEREMKQLEREREIIAAALAKALAEAKDQHSVEIEGLRARLTEAEERTQRAVSQAQLTKAGHVYVISNVGSFGENVFKIGMTRRLVPMERIVELGDASVPFPFDVHMMISSSDAPALENALHRHFHKLRVNKVNPRKEFFRADVEEIARVVRENHGEVDYMVAAEALQYRESLTMSDEDLEFIESVFDEVEEDGVAVTDDL